MTDRTFVMVKPDGVQRGLVGRCIQRYEDRGLKLSALKLVQPSRELAEAHYDAHRDKPFFDGLVDFITSGPVVAMVIEGPNAIEAVREINGATNPLEASPGTIRGDFAVDIGRNIVHGSDAPETAAAEIKLWFDDDQVERYQRIDDDWTVE